MSEIASINHSDINSALPLRDHSSGVPASLRAAARLFMCSFIFLGIATIIVGDALLGALFAFAGLFGWRGFKHGLFRSLCALSGVIAVYIWSVPLGKTFAGNLCSVIELPLVPRRYIGILIVALAFLFLGEIVGWLIHLWNRRRVGRSRRAHVMGMFAGLVQGSLLAVTLSLALVAIEPPVRMALSLIMDEQPWAKTTYDKLLKIRSITIEAPLGRQLAASYAEKHEVLEMGGSLAIISKFPGAVQQLKQDPLIVQLIEKHPILHRIFDEMTNDKDLIQGVKKGDFSIILNNPTVLRLLEDEELAQEIEQNREVLADAILMAVPFEHQVKASEELAKLKGVPLKELQEHARRRLYEIRTNLSSEKRKQLDKAVERTTREFGEQVFEELDEDKLEQIKDRLKQEDIDITDELKSKVPSKPTPSKNKSEE